MSNKLKEKFKYVHQNEHKIWFTIEDVERIIDNYSKLNSDADTFINGYLESNNLQSHKDDIINVRHKLDSESTETLYTILEDFFEYLKYHK